MTAMLAATPGASVVDVGGGHGQLARPLAARDYAVTVLGSHESCVRRIEDLVRQGRCHFVVGDVLHLPFVDCWFDHVLCFSFVASLHSVAATDS